QAFVELVSDASQMRRERRGGRSWFVFVSRSVFPIFGVEVRQEGGHQSGIIFIENTSEAFIQLQRQENVRFLGCRVDNGRRLLGGGRQGLPLFVGGFDHDHLPFRQS